MILPTFESTETFSYEQFLRFAQELEKQTDLYRCELLNGRIFMTPPAGGPHGAVQDNISSRVSSFARESGLGRVFGSSTGYRLPSGDLVEPDIGFVLRSRVPPLEAGKFLELVPDLVVEVVSPSDPKRDFVEKRAVYEANGVREYWVVAPEKKTVLLLVLEGGRFRETLVDLEGSVESSVLPGFRMTARDIFEGLP